MAAVCAVRARGLGFKTQQSNSKKQRRRRRRWQRQRRKFNADASHNILRPISLLQAMNADDLPETVQIAFDDAPVREGGPVDSAMRVN